MCGSKRVSSVWLKTIRDAYTLTLALVNRSLSQSVTRYLKLFSSHLIRGMGSKGIDSGLSILLKAIHCARMSLYPALGRFTPTKFASLSVAIIAKWAFCSLFLISIPHILIHLFCFWSCLFHTGNIVVQASRSSTRRIRAGNAEYGPDPDLVCYCIT